MRPEIELHETRKKWLRRAAQTLAAPFLPFTLLGRGIEKLHDKITRKPDETAQSSKGTDHKTESALLPPENPIEQRIAGITSRLNITNLGTTMENPDAPFTNAMVSIFPFSDTVPAALAITFIGNPYQSGMSPAVITGIIGHEIGHSFTSDGAKKRIQMARTAENYISVGITSGLVPIVAEGWKDMDATSLATVSGAMGLTPATLTNFIQALPSSTLLYSASAIALAIGYSVRHLSKFYSHSTEHIADLRGAEITSPEMVTAALEYLSSKRQKISSLKTAWNKVAHPGKDTHPALTERIALIKKSFNITDNAPQSITTDAPQKAPQPF